MKTLVVYRSHYGSTRRYAQWLAQALVLFLPLALLLKHIRRHRHFR